MKRAALILVLLTSACGSPPPPATPVPPPQKEAKEKPTYPASREPLFVELVAIERKWVAKYVPDAPEDVKAWASTADVPPYVYFVFVKVDAKTTDAAAKASAQKVFERSKKEPIDSVVRTAGAGAGGYWAHDRPHQEKAIADAIAALKPGETSPLFKSSEGWGFVKKAPPPEEKLAKLYRDAKSGEAAKQLGIELTKRLRNSPDMRAAIADAVQAVLGDSAVADPDRPQMNVVDRERIKDAKSLSAAAKAGLTKFADAARPTDVMEAPTGDDDTVIVARAVAAGG